MKWYEVRWVEYYSAEVQAKDEHEAEDTTVEDRRGDSRCFCHAELIAVEEIQSEVTQ